MRVEGIFIIIQLKELKEIRGSIIHIKIKLYIYYF